MVVWGGLAPSGCAVVENIEKITPVAQVGAATRAF